MDCELNERHELPQLLWLMPKTHAVVMDSTSVHQPHRQCESGKSIAEIRCNETVRRNQENWKEKRNHNKIFITPRVAYAFVWFRKHTLSEVRNVVYLLLFKLISEIIKEWRFGAHIQHPVSSYRLINRNRSNVLAVSIIAKISLFSISVDSLEEEKKTLSWFVNKILCANEEWKTCQMWNWSCLISTKIYSNSKNKLNVFHAIPCGCAARALSILTTSCGLIRCKSKFVWCAAYRFEWKWHRVPRIN